MEGLEFIPYTHHNGIPLILDSEIHALWFNTIKAGVFDLVFHDGSINSLDEFTTLVVKSSQTHFWKIEYNQKTWGYFWLNRLERTHAYCHFMAFPKFWGDSKLVDIGKEAMQMCLEGLQYPMIMGMVPSTNTYAVDYLHRVGLQDGGTFPKLLWSAKEQKPVEGKILYITKENLV
ncbi:MAG: hypothetical protein V3U84_10815 [Thiotrichaceae bacterium]